MEAARNPSDLPWVLRSRRFTAECERLRPLGIAYVLRQFGHQLDRADAEDAVAEVIIRFHRRAEAGHVPDNLRAAFLTSARNAAVDHLRSRNARPTVSLEALAEAPAPLPEPEQRAEASDELVRLREALARMRPNYREAIVLRFGLGMSVPEIAAQLQISLPAAKKLVLRSTNQIRERMEAIGDHEFCPEMRAAAQRSLFAGEAAGLAGESDEAALRAHFEHCGPCRTFLAALHQNLHELGSGALLGTYGLERGGILHHLAGLVDRLTSALHSAAARVRPLAYRAGGGLGPDGPASAGALSGTAQKLAAICTAGAATTATCLATGIVGPGLGAATAPSSAVHHHAPPARVRTVDRTPRPAVYHPASRPVEAIQSSAAASTAPTTSTTATTPKPATRKARVEPTARATPEPPAGESASEQEQSEFGIEEEAPAPTATPEVPVASASSSSSSSPAKSSPAPTPAPQGSEEFGFGG